MCERILINNIMSPIKKKHSSSIFISKRKIMLLLCRAMFSALILTSIIACTDNATKLSNDIDSALKRLQSEDIGSEYVIRYEPVSKKDKPYTIIFLPEKETTLNDLINKGVDPEISKDIFSQLSYSNIGKEAMLIVYQAGKINFTTFHIRFATISDIKVFQATGKCEIVVKKINKDLLKIE